MMMPQDFFDLQDFRYKEIFCKEEAVWIALDRLKDYLSSFFLESWPLSGIEGQIERPLVIHHGEVRNDLEVRATGPKGMVQACMNGKPLLDASVIMPGAYLFDDKIRIGAGTIVDAGA